MIEPKGKSRSIRVHETTYEKLREMAFRKRIPIIEIIKKLVDKAK